MCFLIRCHRLRCKGSTLGTMKGTQFKILIAFVNIHIIQLLNLSLTSVDSWNDRSVKKFIFICLVLLGPQKEYNHSKQDGTCHFILLKVR